MYERLFLTTTNHKTHDGTVGSGGQSGSSALRLNVFLLESHACLSLPIDSKDDVAYRKKDSAYDGIAYRDPPLSSSASLVDHGDAWKHFLVDDPPS